MKSDTAKVLHRVCGRPMVEYPVALSHQLGAERTILVLGHQADRVQATIKGRFGPQAADVAIQAEQKGTGHAVQQAMPLLGGFSGKVLILYGDTPLLAAERIQSLIDAAQGRLLSLISMRPDSPSGYGRLFRGGGGPGTGGALQRIIEDRDCTDEQRRIAEVNAGFYVIEAGFLREALSGLRADNAQGEIYLTDVVALAAARSEGAVAVIEAPFDEVQGVNDRVDLARADGIMRRRINQEHMRAGVTFLDPETTYVEPGIVIGRDSELSPGVVLRGKTTIGARCHIEAGCVLTDVTMADDCHLKPYTVATESQIGVSAQLGPFSHLRPGTELAREVHIGNFVELKKTRVGRGSKANHLAYLGDADIGEKVNVGCGTITCNYDGYAKYKTIIEDGAFIGSDTQLVAPVNVGKGAVIAAGTTVIKDVPAGALALSRSPQVHREGYAEKKRERMQALGKDKKK